MVVQRTLRPGLVRFLHEAGGNLEGQLAKQYLPTFYSKANSLYVKQWIDAIDSIQVS